MNFCSSCFPCKSSFSNQAKLIDCEFIDEYVELLDNLASEYKGIAIKYGLPWSKGEIKAKIPDIKLKPIIFFEGQHDLTFIQKAAELLGRKQLLEKVEIRQRGSCSNLDKLWNLLTENNWETTPLVRIYTRLNKVGRVGSLVDICNVDRIVGLI